MSDKAVAERFGVSRPTVWRWTKSKVDFPSPLKISDGVSRWRLSDLLSFEANLANGGSR
ncbi:AlpA family phage regulatory protein [Rhodobacteraceae bacterium R_SAG9]|nr:AlpA family phage regulatory protein [Rhodobacteraceae bacterium R_SAG9]